MKKVLMDNEEQNTVNTNTDQSNDLNTFDREDSITLPNEIIVRDRRKYELEV